MYRATTLLGSVLYVHPSCQSLSMVYLIGHVTIMSIIFIIYHVYIISVYVCVLPDHLFIHTFIHVYLIFSEVSCSPG